MSADDKILDRIFFIIFIFYVICFATVQVR